MGQWTQRPILLGGLGLTAGAWLISWVNPSAAHMGETIMWGAIALSSGMWWFRQNQKKPLDLSIEVPVLDRAALEKEFASVERWLQQLTTEQSHHSQSNTELLDTFKKRLEALKQEGDRTQLKLAIVGGKASGKTVLAKHLAHASALKPADSAQITEVFDLSTEALESSNSLTQTDLVVFLVNGDLTDSELATIKWLQGDRHHLILAFNKKDQYLPDERPMVLQQIRERVLGVVPVQDVVAIAAAPASIKVRQYQADGTMQERMEQPEAELATLTQRLEGVLKASAAERVLATTYRQTVALKAAIKVEVNRLRRDRALPQIEQAQWVAAGVAFATPVPSLDLLATASANAQLVMDLGNIYQQKLSLEQAKAIASALAELMLKLGVVELTSQAITPMLKSHAATFVAGGMVQGASAAYLTRMAGLSLVDYFEEQEALGLTESGVQRDRLMQKLQSVFQANQRSAFLQTLVSQAIQRLKPAANPAVPAANPS